MPGEFSFEIKKTGFLSFKLKASQEISVGQQEAFAFFNDPRNLCDITPAWLGFCMIDKDSRTEVFENAEFDYTIRLLGIRIHWRSRIVNYNPPEHFTDMQIRGPYTSWVHHHTLKPVTGGTLMKDEVLYRIPVIALPLHGILIKKQLHDIFYYRAQKIREWMTSRKGTVLT